MMIIAITVAYNQDFDFNWLRSGKRKQIQDVQGILLMKGVTRLFAFFRFFKAQFSFGGKEGVSGMLLWTTASSSCLSLKIFFRQTAFHEQKRHETLLLFLVSDWSASLLCKSETEVSWFPLNPFSTLLHALLTNVFEELTMIFSVYQLFETLSVLLNLVVEMVQIHSCLVHSGCSWSSR